MNVDKIILIHNGKEVVNSKIVRFRAKEIVDQVVRKTRKYSKQYTHHTA